MKVTKSCYFLIDKTFALFVFVQNVFNKPKRTNPSVVPMSQGRVVVSPPSGSAVPAGGGGASVLSGSTAAGLQRLAAQPQQAALTHSVKLRCQHCNYLFATKPDLLFYKVKRDHERDCI